LWMTDWLRCWRKVNIITHPT
jgi:hypothetical protein